MIELGSSRQFGAGLNNAGQNHVIEKMPTGIEGFDEITSGGLPRGRTSLVMGGPGCGKTIFALQTLVNGARLNGEPGIFVAFEEQSQQITRQRGLLRLGLAGARKGQAFLPGRTPV